MSDLGSGLVEAASDAAPGTRFLNRELSSLQFNARVLALVEDAEVPVLELWGARRKRPLFERLFDCRLEVVAG